MTAAAERRLQLLAHELRDHAAQHFFAAIPETIEPPIADVRDAAVLVDRVQHRGRRTIELAVVLLESRLHADFGVDRDRAQIVAGITALDDCVGEAVDALVVTRHEVDRHAGETPRAPQHRQIFLDDALCAIGAREVLRPHVRDLFACVTEAAQPRVARVDEETVLVQ